MKKMKKIFAVLLTLAMVLGMTVVSYAAPETSYKSDIKVTGLSAQEEEDVKLYAAISLNEAKNGWVVADWAKAYIKLSSDGKKYEITDAAGLTAAVAGTPYVERHVVGKTEVTFADIPVGAYVVTASGVKITYAPMVAETYKAESTYMEAKDVTLVAKTSGYDVKKEADDYFVARGETVTFTITTTFPSFKVADSKDNEFQIIDTPIGLDITEITSLKVGGEDVDAYTTNKAENGVYTIDLTNYIGTTNAHAGKTVVVTYKAVVTADDGYSNTVNTVRNNEKMGEGETKGFTGDITLTKYAEDGTTVLSGAEFKLYKGTKENPGTALYVVQTGNGQYKIALTAEEEGATQTLVATDGTVKVTGLDEGSYWFEETKAPEGYSINEEGAAAEVTEGEESHVSITVSLTDTKLSSLPGTGGIGTTIFTVVGCLLMIAAAGLFFASRKKEQK